MTFAVGHVEGGTHAGWRRVKQRPGEWECDCAMVLEHDDGHGWEVVSENPRVHPGYMRSCPDCGATRP